MRTEPRLKIAIPKQEKLKTPLLAFLEEKGFQIIEDDGDTALLSGKKWGVPNIGVEFVRAADALLLMKEKIVDLAVIGSDVVDENTIGINPRFQKPNTKLDLGIAQCRFQLAVPNQSIETIKAPRDLNGLRIATSYPNILQTWLDKNNVNPSRIVVREGGVESCVRLAMADAVADLVDTGKTLLKNKLTAKFEVARTSARIYSSPSAEFMSEILSNEFLRYLRQSKKEETSALSLQAA